MGTALVSAAARSHKELRCTARRGAMLYEAMEQLRPKVPCCNDEHTSWHGGAHAALYEKRRQCGLERREKGDGMWVRENEYEARGL
eukprot:364929-Chlamydomonas_euryale.AAC.3